MSNWFRFYDDAVNDPKIIDLPDDLYRAWVNLLCIAAKNDGVLPEMKHVALVLRVKPAKAAALIARLVGAELIDNHDGIFAPHNWQGRQFKSDDSGPRVKRHREKLRNAKRNAECNVTVTGNGNALEEKRVEVEEIDRIGSAGASNFTEGSKALASAFWRALGFESPLHIPPEFAGVDWRAVGWENAGWTVDLIATEARRIGPDKPLSYHEKVFATTFAKRQAPLPIVEIQESETLRVNHGKPKNGIIQAADDLRRTIAGFDGPPSRDIGVCSGEGIAPPRLLSHG